MCESCHRCLVSGEDVWQGKRSQLSTYSLILYQATFGKVVCWLARCLVSVSMCLIMWWWGAAVCITTEYVLEEKRRTREEIQLEARVHGKAGSLYILLWIDQFTHKHTPTEEVLKVCFPRDQDSCRQTGSQPCLCLKFTGSRKWWAVSAELNYISNMADVQRSVIRCSWDTGKHKVCLSLVSLWQTHACFPPWWKTVSAEKLFKHRQMTLRLADIMH